MRIGMLSELHPDLDHNHICRLLIRAELAGGLDLKSLSELALNASPLETVSQADQ